MTAYEPKVGDAVEDTVLQKVGKVMGNEGPYVQLRPIGGGREWDADPTELRPLTRDETLSASVAVANERARGERL